MTNIGWTHFRDKIDLEWMRNAVFPPEKLSEFYKNTKSNFMHCPAHANFLKNYWVIKSPFDLSVKYDRQTDSYQIDQTQKFADDFLIPRGGEFTENDHALCSIHLSYLFVADEPVWISVLPPFLHGDVPNTRLICGTYNIYNWQRPIDFSFEILDDKKPVDIKRGQPLMYVSFASKRLNETFKMKEIEMNDELVRIVKSCLPSKYFNRGVLGWAMHLMGNKSRPKRLVK